MSLLSGMFEDGVATCETDCQDHDVSSLYPEERRAVQRAVPIRKREFAAGRHCAREALRTLGYQVGPIEVNEDRSPRWPIGVVGSISHCKTRCVAAVALKSSGYASIGIDVEEAVALEGDLHASICIPEELAAIDLLPHSRRGLAAKAIFSAKECTFKCQSPLTGMMLDFHEIRIDIDWMLRTFEAQFAAGRSGLLSGSRLCGRIREANGYILTGMSLKAA